MSDAPKRSCPDGRISSSVQEHDGHIVLDLGSYIPYFLTAVNNAMSSGASALYIKRFGIGVVDWRVMSTIATEPWCSASRICELVSLDKAAVSRSLHKLSQDGYLDFEANEPDARRRTWTLNARGYALHDEVIAVALDRERQVIAGVDPDDLEAFLRVMRIMRRNVTQMG